MADRMESGRSDQKIPRLYVLLAGRGGPSLLIGVIAVLILGGTIGGFAYRGYMDMQDKSDSDHLVVQFRSENQGLKSQIVDQNAKFDELQDKLASVKAALLAIVPSENTYNINPNQSIIVAGGHLTIGLIGSPTNESVNININGKQQSAATGDVIHIALDPSTACQVGVQSFDMFKAVLTASCAAVKPQ